MENSISTKMLKQQIEELEQKQARELRELKEQFKTTYTALKPVNLIKSTIDDVVHTPGVEDKVISTITGLVTGYLAKNITVGKSDSILKKLIGDAVQVGITTAISTHPQQIKSAIHLVTQLLSPGIDKSSGLKSEKPDGDIGLRNTIMRQITDLLKFVKTNHPPLYHQLSTVPLPERDNNNQISIDNLRKYRDNLRLEVTQFHKN